MKQINVKTQQEYDNIKDQKQPTRIIIEGEEWITVKKVPKNCIVEAGGSAHVEAGGSAHVKAGGSAHVEAYEFVTVTKASEAVVIELFGKALIQDASKEVKFSSLEEWFAWWNLKPKKGKVVMYKAVKRDLTDFYTGKVHYKVGEVVEAPDWSDRFKGECGHALHCSPYLFQTYRYSQGAHTHIEVEVNVEDIRILETPTMRDKVRVKKVTVLKEIKD